MTKNIWASNVSLECIRKTEPAFAPYPPVPEFLAVLRFTSEDGEQYVVQARELTVREKES